MSARIYSRRPNGRFRRPTLENTFGIKAWVCSDCRGITTLQVEGGKPEVCSHCGGKELS